MKHKRKDCYRHHMIIASCCGLGCTNCGVCKCDNMDRPEYGKVYALTGGIGVKAISNGNTWAESEIKN